MGCPYMTLLVAMWLNSISVFLRVFTFSYRFCLDSNAQFFSFNCLGGDMRLTFAVVSLSALASSSLSPVTLFFFFFSPVNLWQCPRKCHHENKRFCNESFWSNNLPASSFCPYAISWRISPIVNKNVCRLCLIRSHSKGFHFVPINIHLSRDNYYSHSKSIIWPLFYIDWCAGQF